jgi:hypothetical protein
VLYTPPAAKSADTSAPAAAAPAARRKGPAQVATNDYRDNWDSIWAHKKSNSVN